MLPDMPTPKVTVAVPVKDRAEQMLTCLDALIAQDHPSYEILVLDNESTDGTPDAVRRRAEEAGFPVRVEVVPGTVGHVRNRAGELARGEYLAFTDSDCVPDPGWLSAAAAALDADPSLGAVQGRTLPQDEIVHGWPATIHVEEYTGRFESCNLTFRRSAFVASDGFDEEVGHFWEDTAAGYALKRAGYECGYTPDALVYHDVTYPGFWWHVKRMQRNAHLGPVLAKYPEIRRDLLLWGLFLQKRDAKFCGAVAGVLLGRRHPAALALALPYLHFLLTENTGGLVDEWRDPKRYAQAVLYDGSRVVGLLRGGLRHGQLVL
jgi:GT2 family glycosyltransferase